MTMTTKMEFFPIVPKESALDDDGIGPFDYRNSVGFGRNGELIGGDAIISIFPEVELFDVLFSERCGNLLISKRSFNPNLWTGSFSKVSDITVRRAGKLYSDYLFCSFRHTEIERAVDYSSSIFNLSNDRSLSRAARKSMGSVDWLSVDVSFRKPEERFSRGEWDELGSTLTVGQKMVVRSKFCSCFSLFSIYYIEKGLFDTLTHLSIGFLAVPHLCTVSFMTEPM